MTLAFSFYNKYIITVILGYFRFLENFTKFYLFIESLLISFLKTPDFTFLFVNYFTIMIYLICDIAKYKKVVKLSLMIIPDFKF